jgi:hypothetical protein
MRLAPALYLPAVLALAACSSPVPATPDAAWTVNFVSPGGQCTLTDSTVQFGDIGGPSDPTIPSSVTDQSPVCTESDGYSNCPMGTTPPAGAVTAAVNCSVWQAGSAFGVHGSASIPAGTDSLEIDISSLPTGATKASPATGTVTYLSDKTVNAFTSSACNFYFASDNEGVGLGKVWVAFTCPEFDSGQSMITGCTVAESYAGFENCSTSPGG